MSRRTETLRDLLRTADGPPYVLVHQDDVEELYAEVRARAPVARRMAVHPDVYRELVEQARTERTVEAHAQVVMVSASTDGWFWQRWNP